MCNPNRRFLSPASTALQVMESHKRFHHGKVVVRENEACCVVCNFLKKYHRPLFFYRDDARRTTDVTKENYVEILQNFSSQS